MMKFFDNKTALIPRAFLISVMTFALCSCGGSNSSGSSSASSSAAAMGVLNLSITDGPSDEFTHVWVTVKAVSVHADAAQIWNPADASWHTTTLPSPVTVDLAALNNGALNNLFPGLTLPAGTYKQIRFFFVGADEALTTSAQANSPALMWNDQVEYVDNTNATQEAPLEIAYPTQGIQLNGTFTVTENSSLNLVVDFDLEHDVVPFKHDSQTAFTLKPNLRYFNLENVGAIAGKVDASQLCVGSPTNNCAYNLIVKAELPTPEGTRHFDVRATTVKADGSFVLYPLPVNDGSGNPLAYDILIRGRNMDSMIIQKVPVTLGTTGTATPTQLQSATPVSLTINANEYTAQFNSPLQPLSSGWAVFQQTLPGDAMPYEIRWGNTDPFTGLLYRPIALAGGPLHVAAYNGGGSLSFASVQPVEAGGVGSYSVATNDVAYYTLSSNTIIQAPDVGSLQTFTPPSPVLNTAIENGSIAGNIAVGANTKGYDHAQIVVARFANIITVTDVSSLLQAGGAYTITDVPAGSATNRVNGAYYYAFVRLWKTGAHQHAKIIPVTGMIDLRKTNSATGVNITIND